MRSKVLNFVSVIVITTFLCQPAFAYPDTLRPKPKQELSDDAKPKELIRKMQGAGHKWSLGVNSSTQSTTFTLRDAVTGEILLQHREKYNDPHYARFGAPEGFLTDVHARDPKSYRVKAIMLAVAFYRGMAMVRQKVEANGWLMSNIKAISGAGQQHGIVLLNKKAREILASLDPNLSLEELEKRLEEIFADPEATIWMNKTDGTEKGAARITQFYGGPLETKEATGSEAELRFSGPAILERYDGYQQATATTWGEVDTILDIAAFIQALCRGDARTPWGWTDASGTNLMDIRTHQWREGIDELAPGLTGKLTALAPPATVVGKISPYLTKFGLSSDTDVATFDGDNPSGAIGQRTALEPDTCSVSLGTSDVLTAAGIKKGDLKKVLRRPTRIHSNVFVLPTGKYMEIACVQNGSLALQSIRDRCIPNEEAAAIFAKRHGRQPDMNANEDKDKIDVIKWEIFEKLISECPPGNNGAMMIPMNTQEEVVRIPFDPNNPIAFTANLTDLSPQNRAQVLRAAVEGRILFLRWLADQMGLKVTRINLTGGASVSKTIQHMVADIFDANVYMLKEDREPVSGGSAINAWKGHYDSTHKRKLSWNKAIGDFAAIDEEKTIHPDRTPNGRVQIYKALRIPYADMIEHARATVPAARPGGETAAPQEAGTLGQI